MSSSRGQPDRGHSSVIHTLLRPTDANCELKRDGRVGGLRNGACALLEETSLIVDVTMSA